MSVQRQLRSSSPWGKPLGLSSRPEGSSPCARYMHTLEAVILQVHSKCAVARACQPSAARVRAPCRTARARASTVPRARCDSQQAPTADAFNFSRTNAALGVKIYLKHEVVTRRVTPWRILVQRPRVLEMAQSRRSVSFRGRDPRTADAPVVQGATTPRSRPRTVGVAGQHTGTVVDSLGRADTRQSSSASSCLLFGSREGDDNVLIMHRAPSDAPPVP
jgi:hypothetical protein